VLEGDEMGKKSENYLHLADLPLQELITQALELKFQHRGMNFGLCTISNARSGRCSEDCAFCAQSSRHRCDIETYGLRPAAEILDEARRAKEAGAQRFSMVTSGRGLSTEQVENICSIVIAIRENLDIEVCCSLGILSREQLEMLKDAGVSRYHHNIETSEEFFHRICTTHQFHHRIATIQAAQDAGLEVCSGGIIGMGEDIHDRISMAETLSRLQVDSMPLNILVPIKGTRLYGIGMLPVAEIIRTVAIWRIIHPDAALRIAGGRETVLKDLQPVAFMAGADAMLIGGYLTVRGRAVEADLEMVREIEGLWKEMYQR